MIGNRLGMTLLPIAAAIALTACSDGGDSRGPAPISIATPNPERCEILDSNNCMFPWPSTVFTVADDSTVTGRRVNMATESMPTNKQGVPVDTTEWNRNDGFSPSQMILAQVPGVDLQQTGAPLITDISRSLEADSPVVVIRVSLLQITTLFRS